MGEDSVTPGARGPGLDDSVRRFYGPLLSFFRKRTRNSPEAQDLVQQVFLRLCEHREDAVGNPGGYVFRTAANILTDHYRRAEVRESYVRGVVELNGGVAVELHSGISPERVLQGRQELGCIVEELRQLPERTRDVFMLRCFEGLKHHEIAGLLGLSERAVQGHYARALARLTDALERMQGKLP